MEQFFISNSPVRSDGLFVNVKPDSPYYEEQEEWNWKEYGNFDGYRNLTIVLTLEKLPVDMLKQLPELVLTQYCS